MEKTKLSVLKQDTKNFNKGTQQGNALLEKSIKKFGFREAATIDKNGVLVGGNKRTAKAQELGFENVEIIKADPSKVYALQYEDIDIDTPEGRELALALNQTAKTNIVIDAEMVEAELSEVVCEEWGVETIEEKEHKENVKELSNMIACTLTDEESEIWLTTKEKIGKMKDKNAIFELIKLYTNENNID